MRKHYALTIALAFSVCGAIQAQDRSSSSMYLKATDKPDVLVPFSISAEGHRFQPLWGLDQAWIDKNILQRGINFMGVENIGIGRSAFRFTKPLINDSVLDAAEVNILKQRSDIFDLVSPTLPIVLTADQGASEGTSSYYVTNRSANIEHWAAMINSHVAWMQQNTKHPITGVSPFNEPDYWTVEEGATPEKQRDVARLLKNNYPRFSDIAIVGANTLNNDEAMKWYTPGKNYYDWGNTHQLAGSFDTFAGFFQQMQADGKVGYADEMHNVGEAMIGLEYGMNVGIWWGFESRARGEFCDISRHGVRLAYGEHRPNWTAASVYRHDDGSVKAFIGCSERQASPTTYQFLSLDHEVYYNGYGPCRELSIDMPGGTGYSKNQLNAERMFDITWGPDVPPSAIDGNYIIMNKYSRAAVTVSGGNICQQKYSKMATQQWKITPVSQRAVADKVGGDISGYDIVSLNSSGTRINVLNHSASDKADLIAYNANGDVNEQWHLIYAGDGYYYIRNRESGLYLTLEARNSLENTNIHQSKLLTGRYLDQQLWRIIPIDATCETKAPVAPVGLTAQAQSASVRLEWQPNSETDLDGYMILRAPTATGQWNTIARKVKTLHFVDNTCQPGQEYAYKIRAIDRSDNQSALSADSVVVTPISQPALIAQWDMEGNMRDTTENILDASLFGQELYTDKQYKSGSKSLSLTGSNYVQLPYSVASTPEFSICMWVFWRDSSKSWQRIFDFGRGTDAYLFLTPSTGSNMRFAIKNGNQEQQLDAPRLSSMKWVHVAVTMGAKETTIYVDGKAVAATTGITLTPANVSPLLNYLGRSQFNTDPYFIGFIDDVRIYNHALNADGVNAAMMQQSAGIANEPVVDTQKHRTYDIDGRPHRAGHKTISIVDGKKTIVSY